ncbi:MAG: lipid-A-disaccharide synthase-related protein [Cyanobacteria bacterium]|nr:lipid-A-disaccharide synthase-related protein [Cyanobacteriota bacterium]
MLPSRLLCICNGHGEDVIANRILAALQQQAPTLDLAAMPLVGEGRCFQDHGIPLVCPTKQLPSGGFIYMDGRQLAKDLQGGLVQLTLAQIRAMGRWAKAGGAILAVGDLVPLLFAWVGGLPYWFVGTAKSEYYLRDEQQRLPTLPWYEGRSRSVYLPWERWLMGRPRCLGVVVRDRLTAEHLQQTGLQRVHTGNPMMDGLAPSDRAAALAAPHPDACTVVLLPGSRAPEAFANWRTLVAQLAAVQAAFAPRPLQFLGAIAPSLDLGELAAILQGAGWVPGEQTPYPTYRQGQATLLLTQDAYGDCLHQADCAIAMAGTATEQVVGLGKPAFTLVGQGPQFSPHFAEAQTRLLGPSVILVDPPEALGTTMAQVLQDAQRLAHIQANGARRMGPPGAADRIATTLLKQWSAATPLP